MELSISGPDKYLGVDQHPHIGLSSLIYLLERSIEHKDSTAAYIIINFRDVGLMTSDKGIAHSERTPIQYQDGKVYPIHGYQVWVALPKEKEEIEPLFDLIPFAQLPKWEANGLRYTLIAGEGFGKTYPLPVHSPLFMIEIKGTKDTEYYSRPDKGEIAGYKTYIPMPETKFKQK